MRKLIDFGGAIFFIGLGLIMIFVFRNPEKLSPENTNKVIGTLSGYPIEGTNDKDDDYIGLWVSGHDDFYEFSSCSYNNKLEEKVKQLSPGDSVFLYVNKSGSSTTDPFKGNKYTTYRICQAYSRKTGQLITFKQYNRCREFQSNTFSLYTGIIMIVVGLFNFLKKIKE